MMRGVESSLVKRLQAQQLGEDLMVRVDLTELGRSDAFETRSRQWVDPVRGLHGFALDLLHVDELGCFLLLKQGKGVGDAHLALLAPLTRTEQVL